MALWMLTHPLQPMILLVAHDNVASLSLLAFLSLSRKLIDCLNTFHP